MAVRWSCRSFFCPAVQSQIDRVFFRASQPTLNDLETGARPEKRDRQKSKREKAHREREFHVGVRQATTPTRDHGRVLATPFLHAEMDNGEVGGTEHAKGRRE